METIVCPLCVRPFPKNMIEQHASTCDGEPKSPISTPSSNAKSLKRSRNDISPPEKSSSIMEDFVLIDENQPHREIAVDMSDLSLLSPAAKRLSLDKDNAVFPAPKITTNNNNHNNHDNVNNNPFIPMNGNSLTFLSNNNNNSSTTTTTTTTKTTSNNSNNNSPNNNNFKKDVSMIDSDFPPSKSASRYADFVHSSSSNSLIYPSLEPSRQTPTPSNSTTTTTTTTTNNNNNNNNNNVPSRIPLANVIDLTQDDDMSDYFAQQKKSNSTTTTTTTTTSNKFQNSNHNGISHSEDDDREFALKLLMEEEAAHELEQQREKQRVLELLESEKQNPPTPKSQRSLKESESYGCQKCQRQMPIQYMYYLDNCVHFFCKVCLRDTAISMIQSKKPSEVRCFDSSCGKPLSDRDLKELLSKEEVEQYHNLLTQQFLENAPNFSTCPKCKTGMEVLRGENQGQPTTDSNGKQLSKEALNHYKEHRLRCVNCQTEFCNTCKETPYHLGFTCDEFKSYKKAIHCRFCDKQLTEKNLAKKSKFDVLNEVCNEAECVSKRKLVCRKRLGCGHACCGLKGETQCPPCLKCPDQNRSQQAEDFCNVCWIEEIHKAPCIQLPCSHFFHASCLSKSIKNGWTGARITFGFLECPLCKAEISHPSLVEDLRPKLELRDLVKKKSMERLEAMNLTKCAELTDVKSRFYQKPTDYALYRFSYFTCFKCKNPYFGGERACEGNQPDFDPKELICGGCCDAKNNCTKHGTEYIEWKCKFCCNVALWFCWGNTHFCDPCHKLAQKLPLLKKSELPKCTCDMVHPPNGEEFVLGCSICRLESAGFKKK